MYVFKIADYCVCLDTPETVNVSRVCKVCNKALSKKGLKRWLYS